MCLESNREEEGQMEWRRAWIGDGLACMGDRLSIGDVRLR